MREDTTGLPARIARIEAPTGERTRWLELAPSDPAGVSNIAYISLAADGRSYAYTYNRTLSDLYLVDGLK